MAAPAAQGLLPHPVLLSPLLAGVAVWPVSVFWNSCELAVGCWTPPLYQAYYSFCSHLSSSVVCGRLLTASSFPLVFNVSPGIEPLSDLCFCLSVCPFLVSFCFYGCAVLALRIQCRGFGVLFSFFSSSFLVFCVIHVSSWE